MMPPALLTQDLDSHLSSAQRAEILAWCSLVENRLDVATNFTCWVESRGYLEYCKARVTPQGSECHPEGWLHGLARLACLHGCVHVAGCFPRPAFPLELCHPLAPAPRHVPAIRAVPRRKGMKEQHRTDASRGKHCLTSPHS